MKSLLLLLSAVAQVALVDSVAIPCTTTSDAQSTVWPLAVSAHIDVAPQEETNAERFRRGLGPKPPVSRTHHIYPRISPAPQVTIRDFTLSQCTGSDSSFSRSLGVIGKGSNWSPAKAVVECASYVAFQLERYTSFGLGTFEGEYICQAGFISGTEETCDASNNAIYQRVLRG